MTDLPYENSCARPTVRVGGQPLPLLSDSVARFRMREALGGMSSLELSAYDEISFAEGASYGATAASPLKLGADVKIYAGETTGPQEIFDGVVTAIEAEAGPHTTPLFTVLAEDRLFPLRRKRRNRTFDAMSPADVVRAIARDHALTPDFDDADFRKPLATWAQVNESDLSFLRRLLAAVDADVQLVGRRLQIVPIAKEARAVVPLTYRRDLLRIRVTADLADQATETRVGGFDAASGQTVSEEAKDGCMGPGKGKGPDGPSCMRAALGEVREHIGHMRPVGKEHARILARAAFGARARRFVRAEGTAQGNGAIRVGSWLEIDGINPLFANAYNVVEATHRFDVDAGYLTDFIAECAYLGRGA